MSKATKNKRIKELERQVKGLTVLFSSLNTWSEYADNMLTELNHALPDPEYDAKCEAAVAGVEASLDRHRERLGLNKPQLKQQVDLSSELTGSELCKAMFARGDKYVMCKCWDSSYADIDQVIDVITGFECTAYKKLFAGSRNNWGYAVPINNQGELLTAKEVGLDKPAIAALAAELLEIDLGLPQVCPTCGSTMQNFHKGE